MATVRDYIAYARATCFPALLPEAANVSGWLQSTGCAASSSAHCGVCAVLRMHACTHACAPPVTGRLRPPDANNRLPACPAAAGAVPELCGDAQRGHEQKGGWADGCAVLPCCCPPACLFLLCCCCPTASAPGLSLDGHRDAMPHPGLAASFCCRRLCLRRRGSWSPSSAWQVRHTGTAASLPTHACNALSCWAVELLSC